MIIKKYLLLLLFLAPCGCAEVAPFVDARREAGQTETIGQSRPERIAVCYNAWWHSTESVTKLADEVCAMRGKRAVPDGERLFNCRLATPSTAFFVCR